MSTETSGPDDQPGLIRAARSNATNAPNEPIYLDAVRRWAESHDTARRDPSCWQKVVVRAMADEIEQLRGEAAALRDERESVRFELERWRNTGIEQRECVASLGDDRDKWRELAQQYERRLMLGEGISPARAAPAAQPQAAPGTIAATLADVMEAHGRLLDYALSWIESTGAEIRTLAADGPALGPIALAVCMAMLREAAGMTEEGG